jgi:transposase
MGTTRRHFTDEFKQEAVGLLTSSGRLLSQIARELGIALRRSLHRASLDGASDRLRPSVLRAWRDTNDLGGAGSPRRSNTQALIPHASPDLAAENARLRRENERLRMEREFLKKTLCIFSEAPR